MNHKIDLDEVDVYLSQLTAEMLLIEESMGNELRELKAQGDHPTYSIFFCNRIHDVYYPAWDGIFCRLQDLHSRVKEVTQ